MIKGKQFKSQSEKARAVEFAEKHSFTFDTGDRDFYYHGDYVVASPFARVHDSAFLETLDKAFWALYDQKNNFLDTHWQGKTDPLHDIRAAVIFIFLNPKDFSAKKADDLADAIHLHKGGPNKNYPTFSSCIMNIEKSDDVKSGEIQFLIFGFGVSHSWYCDEACGGS
jgi:hypothetical protein